MICRDLTPWHVPAPCNPERRQQAHDEKYQRRGHADVQTVNSVNELREHLAEVPEQALYQYNPVIHVWLCKLCIGI